jgi:hypothetical protein
MEFSIQYVEVLRMAITATAGIEAPKPTGLRSAQIGLRVTFLSAFGVFAEMRDFLQRIAVQLPTRCCRRRGVIFIGLLEHGCLSFPQAVAPSGALPALAGASNPNGSNVKALGSPLLAGREHD